jgi:hypothetical protein
LSSPRRSPIRSPTSRPRRSSTIGTGGGADREGTSNYVRFQPVLPIHVDQDWNVIARLYMPNVEQHDVTPTYGTEYGIVGSNLSFFLSPRTAASQDLTTGLGPVVGFPSTNAALASQKWGLGPTAAIVWQPPGPWTIGFLGRHVWSVGGDAQEADINETYLQPFISYTTKDAWTLGANCECTYYWTDDEGSRRSTCPSPSSSASAAWR